MIADGITPHLLVAQFKADYQKQRNLHETHFPELLPILDRLNTFESEQGFQLTSQEWAKIVFEFLQFHLASDQEHIKAQIPSLLKPILQENGS